MNLAKRELAEAGVSMKVSRPSTKSLKEKEDEFRKMYLDLFTGKAEQTQEAKPSEQQEQAQEAGSPEQQEQTQEAKPSEQQEQAQEAGSPEQQEQTQEAKPSEQQEQAQGSKEIKKSDEQDHSD
jgi:uncharacterized membrane protein